eukprot:8312599-Alexandrium_andersonii.AAC.1
MLDEVEVPRHHTEGVRFREDDARLHDVAPHRGALVRLAWGVRSHNLEAALVAPEGENAHVARDDHRPPVVVPKGPEEVIGYHQGDPCRVRLLERTRVRRREDAGGEAVLRQLVPVPVDALPAVRFREDGEVRALGQE